MKCEKCGYVSNADFKFCKNCGAPAPEEILPDCATPKILKCAKSNLFFILCILLAASSVISAVNIFALLTVSGIIGISKNIIILITTAACWMIYFDSKRNEISSKHLKLLSFSVLLKYIWNFFGGAAIMLIGGFACAFPFFAAFFQAFEYGDVFNLEEMLESGGIFAIILCLIIGVFIILLGIVAIIINIIGRRPIHRFTKSLYKSVEAQNEEYKISKGLTFWLIAFTVIYLVADLFMLLSNPTTILAFPQKALYYAALIIAVFLIKDYFKKDEI